MKKKYNTIEIKTLFDFIKEIEIRKDDPNRIVLFRGQNTDKALIPKIARHFFVKSREIDEKRMFNEFKLLARPFLHQEFLSDIEWLTVAQHHGLPTRLLDWTENPLTALYFATQKHLESDEQYSVVWVMSLNRESELLLNDLLINPFELEKIKIFKPANFIQRITSQMGWLSIHNYYDKGFYGRAEDLESETVRFTKIIIPNEYVSKLNKALNLFGINEFSIYQDLDSLSKTIFKKYKKLL
jgi:hypothetical protein